MKEKRILKNDANMIAFFFDSGKIENSWYGASVYEAFLEGKEISSNTKRVIISLGDIIDKRVFRDIAPFIVHDTLCTISRFPYKTKDFIYVILAEDIETKVAIQIDQRLKNTFSAYIGMTSVNPESKDTRKQFWKLLIRHHSIENTIITCFSKIEENDFNYTEIANKYNFTVNYDELYSFQKSDGNGNILLTRQSSFVNLSSDMDFVKGENESDRGLEEMNSALVRETEIAGILIWKAIEDIDRSYIPKEHEPFYNIGCVFTSIYQASQGIERLLKIILTLIKYRSTCENEKIKIDELLLSHSHVGMCDFIEENEKEFLNRNTRKLLELLYDFYSKCRYHRYTYANDDTLELRFFKKFAIDVKGENYDEDVKNIYGKFLGELARDLYLLIRGLSRSINTYIYEVPYTSSAIRVFLDSEKNLYKLLKQREQSKKELLWYLIKKGNKLPFSIAFDGISPLDFEECEIQGYVSSVIKDNEYSNVLYEFMSSEYEVLIGKDKKSWKLREEIIKLLGNSAVDIIINDDFEEYNNEKK